MGDATIEGQPQNCALSVDRARMAEVLPQAQGQRWQFESAPSGATVRHGGITVLSGNKGHGVTLSVCKLLWSQVDVSGVSMPFIGYCAV